MTAELGSVHLADAGVAGGAVEDFIDKAELCRRLKARPRTVDAWMQRGLLPYYKLGRAVRFRWSEVQSHLEERCHVCREFTKAGLCVSSAECGAWKSEGVK